MARFPRKTPQPVRLPDSGIYVFESRHAEGFRMEMDRWPFHKLCWIAQGKGWFRIGDAQASLTAGTVLFVPRGCEHQFEDRAGDPMTLYMACFSERPLEGDGPLHSAWQIFSQAFPAALPVPLDDPFRRTYVFDRLKRMIVEQSHQEPGFDSVM